MIFDMDGVIVDSESIHQRAEIYALSAYGLEVTDQDLRPYAGASRQAFQDGLTERFDLDLDWKGVFEKKDELFFQLIEDVEAIPGVLDFIQEIKAANLKLGVATSSQKRNLSFILQKFGLEPFFDALVCAADISRSKPDPEIFLKAAAALGEAPEDCAAVEDSVNGVRAAKSAGMYTIALTTTFPLTALVDADRIIDGFPELKAEELLRLKRWRFCGGAVPV
ncbi:MAG: HAD family phosphatase [Candidatus Omnitrophota bacterium]